MSIYTQSIYTQKVPKDWRTFEAKLWEVIQFEIDSYVKEAKQTAPVKLLVNVCAGKISSVSIDFYG